MNEMILAKLAGNFKDAILSSNEFRGELTVVVKKEEIVPVCRFLRDDPELKFDLLSDLCGADMLVSEMDRGPEVFDHDYENDFTKILEQPQFRFQVIYNICSLEKKARLRLKVLLTESEPHVETVTSVWPGSEWLERETFDMLGIIFDGHPDLRRIYMADSFEYFPLRKDFPLMGIPGSLPLPGTAAAPHEEKNRHE